MNKPTSNTTNIIIFCTPHISHLDEMCESDENECVSFEILTSNERRAATAAIKTNGYKHNFYVAFSLIVQ